MAPFPRILAHLDRHPRAMAPETVVSCDYRIDVQKISIRSDQKGPVVVAKLVAKHSCLRFCYEVGPMGCGLRRRSKRLSYKTTATPSSTARIGSSIGPSGLCGVMPAGSSTRDVIG